MRKTLLLAALALPLAGFAQIFSKSTAAKIDVPAATPSVAAISPKGDYLLLTSAENNGLVKYDLATRDTTRITSAAGAGYGTTISADGTTVVYRESSIDKHHLRHIALHSVNLASGKSRRLLKPSRDLEGYALNGGEAEIVAASKRRVKSLPSAAAKAKAETPTLSISNGQLMITRGSQTSQLSPSGADKSYIWPSLSPSGNKILYYVAGEGAFVCDIDGSNVRPLGIVRAPKWYDDDTVVGMLDLDDGEFVYASTIVAATLDGRTQTLSPEGVVAMYPQPSAESGKISFSTPAGETYIINVEK